MSATQPQFELPQERELPGAILALGLPVLAEQLLSFCVGFFDVYLSGRLNAEATAAIGLAAYVSWLASMMSGLVGMGAAALVARTCGAGDWDEARRVTARALMLGGTLGLGLCVTLWVGAPLFVSLLDMQGATRQISLEYLRYDACGQVFACTTMIAAACLRGAGDMRTPLYVLGMTNVINVAVSSVCVFGWGGLPALGVRGIVVGTITSHICGLLLMTAGLSWSGSRLRLQLRDIRWHQTTAVRILRVGGPAALDGLVTFVGHFLFLMIIARLSPGGFDGPTFAAHVVGVRAEAISYLPAVAWGAASASLAGRLIGARQRDLAQRVGHLAVRQFLLYAVIVSTLMYWAAPSIFAFMHRDPAVGAVGVPAFRWLAIYQIPTTVLIIYAQTLRGAGDTRFPLWCALISILGVRVPIAWLGGIWFDGGLVGAWYGMGADNTLRMLLITWRYRAGRWRDTEV